MPDLRHVVVPHPIGGIRPGAVAEKARAALPDLLAVLAPERAPAPIAGGGR